MLLVDHSFLADTKQFGLHILLFLAFTLNAGDAFLNYEVQRYDGWYNNLAHPSWGTVGSKLHRKVVSNYSDGVYMIHENLPSARELSDLVFQGSDGMANRRNVTAMLAFFSQAVAYEILQASEPSCPLEMYKIPIDRCDRIYDEQCAGATTMPFFRAKYDRQTGEGFNSPREQTNDKTSWIDGSFLYSTQVPWVNTMRSYKNGTLREGTMPGYPPLNTDGLPLINPSPPHVHKLMDPERMFLLGDPRINENPALLSFGLMFYRWHNVQARRLQAEHPEWSDFDLFDRARQWVIAALQNIILYEFVPALLNTTVPPYESYNPEQPPGISHVFAAAAFRYPHTLVPPGMYLRNGQCRYRRNVGGHPAVRLCNTWWNAQDIVQQYTVDEIILGMASQLAEKDDHVLVSDLRDFVFGPMHFSRRDLGALTLMRGRDNGLPSYNTVRKAYHLPEKDWHEINPKQFRKNRGMYDKLRMHYRNEIGNLDVYVGGMLEGNGQTAGELFTTIIKEQFLRLRSADRFWFENKDNGLFTDEEIRQIRSTTLHDIIIASTNIEPHFLQKNVFYFRHGDPCPQPFQFMTYDYFQGNEVAFIFTCILLGLMPIVCGGIGYMVIKHRHKHFACKDKSNLIHFTAKVVPATARPSKSDDGLNEQTARAVGRFLSSNAKLTCKNALNSKFDQADKTACSKNRWSILATEWLHERYSRTILVCVSSYEELLISLEKRRGGVLRRLNLASVAIVKVCMSDENLRSGQPYCKIAVPKQYDVVVKFDSRNDASKFLLHLEDVLKRRGKAIQLSHENTNVILETAETREKHQRKLEHFFREAYAKAFNLRQFMGDLSAAETIELEADCSHDEHPDVCSSVLETTLTRAEFAEALGMKEDDLFIQRMFSCVARVHEDKICFNEFLKTLLLFSTGTLSQKMQIIFKMCDPEDTGSVDRNEFCSFLCSIVKAVGSELNERQQRELIESMIETSEIPYYKQKLSYKDFEALLNTLNTDKKPIGLHFKGRLLVQAQCNYDQSDGASLNSFSLPEEEPVGWLRLHANNFCSFLEDYRQHIICLVVFFLITLALFFERFWHYATYVEQRDMRRVMGIGIAITRGAASAMSFSFSILPVTVCKNVITLLRDTPLNEYVPFDAAIAFHKTVALVSLFFAAIHTIGHCINFYHISTQAPEGLNCLFQEAVFSSDFQPSFTYWLYESVTGVTGILLVLVLSIMYVFAAPSIINNAYYAFRITHLLNVIFYVLMLVHGLPKLLDAPRFWYFLIGPAIIVVFDRILSQRRKYRQLDVLNIALLPSDVTYIEFKRPRHFIFRSGQWIKINCPAFNCNFNEWHAFSIASSPHDSTLEVYVKAQGPWTWKLREVMHEVQQANTAYPVLHMEGPFGGGNQDWYNYEVAVMVGGGIGVTPYSAMLMDLVKTTSSERHSDVACRKVYFVWICPTHRNFEWFIEVLKKVEAADKQRILEIHIFVTQFFHRFDLRTTMLYICEKHFQGLERRSMFTGLSAVNHFGRPNMTSILKHIQDRHPPLSKIGVFSCGPSALNRGVHEACEEANRTRKLPSFIHKYETF